MSSIKLKHSGGNSVSIAAPTSNPSANRTLLLPSDADSTIDTLARTGNILQVVQASTQAEKETSDTQLVDTNLESSITPIAAGSKILINIAQQLSINTTNSGGGGGLNLLRKVASGSFSIIENSPSNSAGPFSYFLSVGGGTALNYHFRHNLLNLDSPSYSLGDAITYKTQMRLFQSASGTVLRAQNDAADVIPPTSFIVLMEVAG